MSATMDLQSGPEGAVVLARLGGRRTPAVDGLALAMAGETASGDAWGTVADGEFTTILLVDGLGHGDDAATAANAARARARDRAGRRRRC